MVSFRAFLDPGLDSWVLQNAFVKIHQQRKLLKWFRDSWLTTREKVHKVEESDIYIGQLQGIKYVKLIVSFASEKDKLTSLFLATRVGRVENLALSGLPAVVSRKKTSASLKRPLLYSVNVFDSGGQSIDLLLF